MYDLHIVPEGWGIYPTLLGISSYGLFVFLGIAAGCIYYFLGMRRMRTGGENAAIIVLAALLGGALGAKVPVLVMNFQVFATDPGALTTGKTVLGGLLGGFLGVILIKKILHIRGRYGNVIAPAAALGFSIGRIGCLLTGCCFGKATGWGLEFGDGIQRYPTQIFEIVFHFSAFCVLHFMKKRVCTPGILFKGYVIAYLIFRYVTEFLRESEILYAGHTLYQLLCVGGILLMGGRIAYMCIKEKKGAAFHER